MSGRANRLLLEDPPDEGRRPAVTGLRPDVVFVVTGAVWRDFVALRARWDEPLCLGFDQDCAARIRQAARAGDPDRARHWRAVRDLAACYGVSWVSAVEVDGDLVREAPRQPCFDYPADNRLKRVVLASDTAAVFG